MSTEDLTAQSIRQFTAATADKTPTPGGGSVAGVVGALATSLGEMALAFTRGKKKYAEHEAFHAHLAERLAKARAMFFDLVADDVSAYTLYQTAMTQEDSHEKNEAVQLATAAAIDVPRETAKLALAVLEDLKELQPRSNPWLMTDLLAAGALAAAVARLCDYNVRVNLKQVADRQAAEDLRRASAEDLRRAEGLSRELDEAAKTILP